MLSICDPGFLFDFYSDRGSTATPYAHSNVSWGGLMNIFGQQRRGEVVEVFSNFDRPWNKN